MQSRAQLPICKVVLNFIKKLCKKMQNIFWFTVAVTDAAMKKGKNYLFHEKH